MANRQEVREFLTARQARITPEQVGLPRPSVQWVLEAITDGVAFVRDPHQNLLASWAAPADIPMKNK